MQLVYTNENFTSVALLQMFLAEHGIECQIRNQHSSSVMGEVPFFSVWPELWTLDEHAVRAKELIRDFEHPKDTGEDWLCNRCGETNYSNFEICWQCESAKPERIKQSSPSD